MKFSKNTKFAVYKIKNSLISCNPFLREKGCIAKIVITNKDSVQYLFFGTPGKSFCGLFLG